MRTGPARLLDNRSIASHQNTRNMSLLRHSAPKPAQPTSHHRYACESQARAAAAIVQLVAVLNTKSCGSGQTATHVSDMSVNTDCHGNTRPPWSLSHVADCATAGQSARNRGVEVPRLERLRPFAWRACKLCPVPQQPRSKCAFVAPTCCHSQQLGAVIGLTDRCCTDFASIRVRAAAVVLKRGPLPGKQPMES